MANGMAMRSLGIALHRASKPGNRSNLSGGMSEAAADFSRGPDPGDIEVKSRRLPRPRLADEAPRPLADLSYYDSLQHDSRYPSR